MKEPHGEEEEGLIQHNSRHPGPQFFATPSFDDLYDQDSVVGSDGLDGMNDEGKSDCLDY
jgi:hypothetical protein